MYFTRFLALALPVLAAAQQESLQQKAQHWWERVQDLGKNIYQQSVGAGAAKVAANQVHYLTADSWKQTLQHSGKKRPYSPPEAWMVLITGGNRTCKGHCERLNGAWNESAAYFAADPSAPQLAVVDCDQQELLCGAWVALPSTIWFFLIPQPAPDQSRAPTTLTIHGLNASTVTDADITRIHTRQQYLVEKPYEGIMHPFDGIFARLGLTMPLAYFLYAVSLIPSWAFMIFLSFASRYFVSKRLGPQPQAGARGAAPAAAPAPAPAAAK